MSFEEEFELLKKETIDKHNKIEERYNTESDELSIDHNYDYEMKKLNCEFLEKLEKLKKKYGIK